MKRESIIKAEIVVSSCNGKIWYKKNQNESKIYWRVYYIANTDVKGFKVKFIIDMMSVIKEISLIEQYNDSF